MAGIRINEGMRSRLTGRCWGGQVMWERSRDRTAGLENPTQTHEPGGGEISVTEEGGQRDIMTDTLLHLPQKSEDGVTPELTAC